MSFGCEAASGVETALSVVFFFVFEVFGEVTGPAVDIFLVDLIDLGAGVHPGIGCEGHFTFAHFFDDLGEEKILFFSGIAVPGAEIQIFTTVIDVVGDHEGDGGDTAVPGKVGLIAVAVEAGISQNAFGILIHGEVLGDGWVFEGHRNELHEDKAADEDDPDDEGKVFIHALSLFLLIKYLKSDSNPRVERVGSVAVPGAAGTAFFELEIFKRGGFDLNEEVVAGAGAGGSPVELEGPAVEIAAEGEVMVGEALFDEVDIGTVAEFPVACEAGAEISGEGEDAGGVEGVAGAVGIAYADAGAPG